MYKNVGKTIMDLATVFTFIGIILSTIAAFYIWLGLDNFLGVRGFWWGIFVLAGGSFSSWINSFFIYGFGQLVRDLARMAGPDNRERHEVSLSSEL